MFNLKSVIIKIVHLVKDTIHPISYWTLKLLVVFWRNKFFIKKGGGGCIVHVQREMDHKYSLLTEIIFICEIGEMYLLFERMVGLIKLMNSISNLVWYSWPLGKIRGSRVPDYIKLGFRLKLTSSVPWLIYEGVMVFNATFNNISVILWRSVLLV